MNGAWAIREVPFLVLAGTGLHEGDKLSKGWKTKGWEGEPIHKVRVCFWVPGRMSSWNSQPDALSGPALSIGT